MIESTTATRKSGRGFHGQENSDAGSIAYQLKGGRGGFDDLPQPVPHPQAADSAVHELERGIISQRILPPKRGPVCTTNVVLKAVS